jgi:hypothetical protein
MPESEANRHAQSKDPYINYCPILHPDLPNKHHALARRSASVLRETHR